MTPLATQINERHYPNLCQGLWDELGCFFFFCGLASLTITIKPKFPIQVFLFLKE